MFYIYMFMFMSGFFLLVFLTKWFLKYMDYARYWLFLCKIMLLTNKVKQTIILACITIISNQEF